jgi:hypothetical protein
MQIRAFGTWWLTSALVLGGCSATDAPGTETQTITGHLSLSARGADHVIAIRAGTRGSHLYSARVPIAEDKSFRLSVPEGERYLVHFEAAGRVIGTLAFPHAEGGTLTHLFSVDGNEGIDLGECDEEEGDFLPEHNPLEEVDQDLDGESDYADSDDDDDGTADTEDEDDDENGVDDADEDWDSDDDGTADADEEPVDGAGSEDDAPSAV